MRWDDDNDIVICDAMSICRECGDFGKSFPVIHYMGDEIRQIQLAATWSNCI